MVTLCVESGAFIIDRIDHLTVASLAVISVVLAVAFHETTHAIVCLALGGEITRFSAVHVHVVMDAEWKSKLVAASGSLANLLLAVGLWLPLKRAASWDHCFLFFIWLFFSINLMSGAGYWFASGIANTGDWAIVIRGWQPRWAYQIGLVVLGAVTLMAGVGWALVEFGRLVGTHGEKPIQCAQRIAMTCYAAAFVVMLVIGLAQPGGPLAFPGINGLAGVLGGLSPLLWMMQWFRAEMFKRQGTRPLRIQRSVPSAVVAGAAVILAVIVTLVGQQ